MAEAAACVLERPPCALLSLLDFDLNACFGIDGIDGRPLTAWLLAEAAALKSWDAASLSSTLGSFIELVRVSTLR